MTEDTCVAPSESDKTIDEAFEAAVCIVQNMPKDGPLNISNSQKLQFYALFKQATIGPCNQPRPSMFNMVERYKWDAWNSLQNLDKTKAKQDYVSNIQSIFDSVGEKLNWPEMVSPEKWKTLEPIIRPKLKLIGRRITEESEEPEKPADTSDDQNTTETQNTTTTESSVAEEVASVLSDDEFMDAFDVPHEEESKQYPHNFNFPNESTASRIVPSSNHETASFSALSSVVNHFESHINVLTKQINVLNTSLVEQRSIVVDFMNRMNQIRRRGIQGMSWWMFAFFLLWPFFAQMFLRWLIRRLFTS